MTNKGNILTIVLITHSLGVVTLAFGFEFPLEEEKKSFATGQTPVMQYHHGLMMSILKGKANIAKAVNATVIGLENAPRGYDEFDSGVAKKFVLDPHNLIRS